MITLDPKAVDYFNNKADEFLHQLKPAREESPSPTIETSASQIFTQTITDKDIINFNTIGTIDGFGRQLSRYFTVENKSIGLREEDYPIFDTFVENLYKRREINTFLSKEFLIDITFKWFKDRYTGIIDNSSKYVSYLLEKAENSIQEVKVSIPISFLIIEKPFKVGNVIFEYFPKKFFDEFSEKIEENAKHQKDYDEHRFKEGIIKIRKKYQGIVFSSITNTAEKKRCLEIAIEETEKALMILRFFSPTAFIPEIPSYFGRMGQTDIPKDHDFFLQIFFRRFLNEQLRKGNSHGQFMKVKLKI